jgi:ABC-type sugar transport system, permease component
MIRKKSSTVILYVVLVFVILLSVFPFVWMLANSFMSEAQIYSIPPRFWPEKLFKKGMWDNYKTVLNSYSFFRYILNSLFVAGLASVGQIIVCPMAAFAFAKMKFPGSKLFFTLLLVTLMIPVQVLIIPEYYLMMRFGWLDTYLPLIVPSFLAGAFGTFMFISVFESVPEALFDAAIIDGANAWKIFWQVYYPEATAPLATLFIIAFMNNWNDLLRPMLYISKPAKYTVTLGLMQFQTAYASQWDLVLAGSVLSVLPLIILYIFCQRYIIENSLSSGVKG